MLRLILLAFLVIAFVAIRYLPWWGIVLTIFGLLVAARYLGGWFVKRGIMSLFHAKSRALKGARLEVHEIRVAAPPAPEEGEETEPDPRPHFLVDATITPVASRSGAFEHWEPGELLFVRPGTPTPDKSRSAPDDDVARVVSLDIESEGKFSRDEGLKFAGPLRLRLLVAVAPDEPELVLRYYFEDLGPVRLSGAALMSAG